MADAATKTASKLFIFAVAMFGFGYAMVPLYNVFCDITGLNGKTGQISVVDAEAQTIDKDRLVTVEFDTNVNKALPWRFSAAEYKKSVHPGEIAEMIFVVENVSDQPVIGRAVPSVAPTKASQYFDKTECFCFVEQELAAGERKEMVVRFIVDTKLPEKISTMTLSYTFFEAANSNEISVSETSSLYDAALKSKS